MQGNYVGGMTSQVMDLVDQVLFEISKASKGLLVVDMTWNMFYPEPLIVSAFREGVVTLAGESTILGWIDVLRGNAQYRTAVNAAALSFKSPVQMALYGI